MGGGRFRPPSRTPKVLKKKFWKNYHEYYQTSSTTLQNMSFVRWVYDLIFKRRRSRNFLDSAFFTMRPCGPFSELWNCGPIHDLCRKRKIMILMLGSRGWKSRKSRWEWASENALSECERRKWGRGGGIRPPPCRIGLRPKTWKSVKYFLRYKPVKLGNPMLGALKKFYWPLTSFLTCYFTSNF